MILRTSTFAFILSLICLTALAQKQDTTFFDSNMNQISAENNYAYMIIYHDGLKEKVDGLVEIKTKQGSLMESMTFKKSVLHGPYKKVNYADRTYYEGEYKRGTKVGDWILFNEQGEFLVKESFSKDGLLDNITTNTNIARETEVVDSTAYDEEARYPTGMEGWNAYLSQNLKYPKVATRGGYEGSAFIEMIVLEDGQLVSLRDLSKPDVHESLVNEAKRVIAGSGKWIPAKKNGIPVASKMKLQIRFRLK